MQYTVNVKALHPIKGWVKFSFEVEAESPEDAVVQAKKQPRVKDYSIFNVLSTASAVDQHPVPIDDMLAKEQVASVGAAGTGSVIVQTKPQSEPPKPEVPPEPEKLPVDQPKVEQAQPQAKKGF